METTTQKTWKANVDEVLIQKGYIAVHITTKDNILETYQIVKSRDLPRFIDTLIIDLVDPVIDFPSIATTLEKMEEPCMRTFRNHEHDHAQTNDDLERVEIVNPRFWFRVPISYIDKIIDLMKQANHDDFLLDID